MKLDQFQLDDPKKLFAELTAFALQGEHSKFEFITSLGMRSVCRTYKRGIKRVIKIFKSLRDALIEAYTDAVNSGKILPDDVEMITAIRNFDRCYKFYRYVRTVTHKDIVFLKHGQHKLVGIFGRKNFTEKIVGL